jgi:plastocyanin
MQRRRDSLLLFTVLVAAIVAAGAACGGGDDKGSSGSGTGAVDGASGTAKVKEVPAGAPQIDQKGLEFIPNKLSVKAKQKVYFKNSETAIHTVTINGKNISGNMKRDEVVEWTPTAAGDYKVTCDYHPQMKATITVE